MRATAIAPRPRFDLPPRAQTATLNDMKAGVWRSSLQRGVLYSCAIGVLGNCGDRAVDEVGTVANVDRRTENSRDASISRDPNASPQSQSDTDEQSDPNTQGATTKQSPNPGQNASADSGASATAESRLLDGTSATASDLPLQTDFDAQSCPALDLRIDMSADEEYQTDHGVLVKVLARPEFTEANRADPDQVDGIPPDQWDRNEFPLGACVVRLRGIDAECYTNQHSMALYLPPSDAGSPVGQASYHARRWASTFDLCDWPIPGCPRAEWDTFRGYWWYLTPRSDDALLVACAPSCEGFFRAPITVQLRPDGPVGLCDDP